MISLILTLVIIAIILIFKLNTNLTTYLVESCLEAARKEISYKDPESLRIESSVVYTEKNPRIVNLSINAKNSYGAYAGAKSVYCVLLKDDPKTIVYVVHDDSDISLFGMVTNILKEINEK